MSGRIRRSKPPGNIFVLTKTRGVYEMVRRPWELKLRGGPWDGATLAHDEAPKVIVACPCPDPKCRGHFFSDPFDPEIDIHSSTTYRRTEMDEDTRIAVYDVGANAPDEDLELTEEQELFLPTVAEARRQFAGFR
jgi:hypothetical protein